MLSISTSWFDDKTQNLKEWLPLVKSFGYNNIELSYKITKAQLAEAIEILPMLDLAVSSIHNFCPTPDDGNSTRHISNYYRLSSLDEEERKSAVKWTKIAVDTAVKVNAKVVVIHAGTLDFEDERSPKLFKLFVEGKQDTDEFIAERNRILDARANNRGPFIDALDVSMEDVVSHARECGIKIGLETRYYPIEIPNFDEVHYYLDKYGADVLGYWHDVGHAEINGRLGIMAHEGFLDAYQSRLIGVHIHGMKGRRDHLAPFEGDMDLNKYLPYFKNDVIKVVESKPFADLDLIKDAVEKLI